MKIALPCFVSYLTLLFTFNITNSVQEPCSSKVVSRDIKTLDNVVYLICDFDTTIKAFDPAKKRFKGIFFTVFAKSLIKLEVVV